MLRYILILCLVRLSRQGNEGWHPIGGDPVVGTDSIDPSLTMDEGNVVASGWYPEESLYEWVEVSSDADGFRLLNDSNLLNYTYSNSDLVVFHFHSKSPKERALVSDVKKIFKTLKNTQFESGTAQFGTNSPSIKMQETLNMTKVPCLAFHKSHDEVVYYKGKLERQGISDFISSIMGKVEQDEGVPLTLEKGVFVVNKGNYKNFINGPLFAMIYYYEEGCSVCAATFPAFENLMTKYNHTDDQVWLGQFKTSKIEALLEYNITSLPVITYGMMGGKRLLYKEPLDQFSIEMFITTQMVFDESQYAIQLNAERFYSFLKLKPVVMVKFVEAGTDQGYPDSKTYAAWSVMAQKWEHPVVFATINTTEHKLRQKEMDERIGLVMYKWGTMYQIPFTFKKTQDYTMLNMITDKISAEVQDNMITELRDSQVVDTFLLGIFPGKLDTSAVFQHYEQTVLSYEDRQELVVLHSFDKATAARFKVTSPSMVLLYPAESVTVDKATPNYKVLPISTSQSVGTLVMEILMLCHNSTNFPLITSTDYTGLGFHDPFYTKHLVTIYLPLDWGADNWSNMNHWTEKIKPLAIEYKSKGIIFVYADEETNYDIIQDLGIREGTISELIFTITNNELQRVFYPKADDYEGPFIDVLKGFVDKYMAGELSPKIRSQQEVAMVPGRLATVVGSNAERFMVPLRSDTLAITLLYKEHTQEVLNAQLLMEILAEKYANISTLRFGKLELARNDLFFKLSPVENSLVFSDQYKQLAYTNMMDSCTGSLIDFEACITRMQVVEVKVDGVTLKTGTEYDMAIKDEPEPDDLIQQGRVETGSGKFPGEILDDEPEDQVETGYEKNIPKGEPGSCELDRQGRVETGSEEHSGLTDEMLEGEPEGSLLQQGQIETGYEANMPKDEPEGSLLQQGQIETGYEANMPKDEPEGSLLQQGQIETGYEANMPKDEPEGSLLQQGQIETGYEANMPKDEPEGSLLQQGQIETGYEANMPKDAPLLQLGKVETGYGQPPGFTSDDEPQAIEHETGWKSHEEPAKTGQPKDEL